MQVPWFARSPSPFSIIFYTILALYAMKKLLRKGNYKRFKHLVAFTDAILIVGFIVLLTDTFWIVACALRFGSQYPDSIDQLFFAAGRNVAGLVLCFMLIGNYFMDRTVQFNGSTRALLCLNIVFLWLWFWLSPSPAYTDWTFALKHNYPLATVLTSFFVSHGIGKGLVASIFYTVWKR